MAWLVYTMTHSAFMLGFVGFISRVPTFFFAPFGGVVADRTNRYHTLILTQVLAMVQSIILTILLFTNSVQVWHLIVLGFMLGLINSFDVPVRQSFVIQMIEDKKDLGSAIALNSAMVNSARMFGPTIAGILVATVGEGWCFLLNSISFIPVIISLLLMHIKPVEIRKNTNKGIAEFKDGLKYVFHFPPIKNVLLLLATVSLLGMPIQVLMPVFAKEIFHGGAHTLGFLMAFFGIGALAGALYLASRKSIHGYYRNITIAASIFGFGLIAFSLSNILWLGMILLLFTGFGMMVQMTSSNTIIQTIVDDDKRGRVMSFYTMAFMGMVPFGNLLGGTMADAFGVKTTVIVGGLICITSASIFSSRLPKVREMVRPVYIEKQILQE